MQTPRGCPRGATMLHPDSSGGAGEEDVVLELFGDVVDGAHGADAVAGGVEAGGFFGGQGLHVGGMVPGNHLLFSGGEDGFNSGQAGFSAVNGMDGFEAAVGGGEDGIQGMRFLEKVVESSLSDKKWIAY